MKKSLTGFLSIIILLSILLLSFLFITSFETSAQNNNIKNELVSKVITVNASLDQYYRMKINNLNIPFNNRGNIANARPDSAGGYFGGHVFLFSGGFIMSGKSNDSIWTNGVASDILVLDYSPGRVQPTPIEPPSGFYVVKKSDPDFGLSWQEWTQAVYLGADFYDGDGDGKYYPVDLNANGKWDPNEDMPDLLGDETAWCVYSDNVPQNLRRWLSPPYGIEIRQTIFAYSNISFLSNVFFIRYRIKNTGAISNQLDSVYFGLWADADLGNAVDDLVGCDTLRNTGFMYNDGEDLHYGQNAPAFFLTMLTTPHEFIPGVTFTDINGNGSFDLGIDIPLDSALINRGPIIGQIYIPGSKNLGMSSFVFYASGENFIDIASTNLQARFCLQGYSKYGVMINPCSFLYSTVNGNIDCNLINNLYWVSGDPVTNIGWINNKSSDLRFSTNCGPFNLCSNEEVELLAAYIVGRGASSLSSISHARAITDDIKWFYDNNFNSSLISVKDEQPTIDNFILYQNYPNPFNPVTKIKYQIPKKSFTVLKIFDVLGKETATLVSEVKEKGIYEVDFDGSSIPSGVYFYQLITENFSASKKMILLK